MGDRDGVLDETDVLIVGGGVIGCATAYYFAREGGECLVIDRTDLNTQASGRNAGSLHVQLQSMIFKEDTEGVIRARAETLPLFMEAVRTWKQLDAELEDDFELSVEGGLMVAETEDQIRFMEGKLERERRQGIDVEILDQAQVQALAPYLSDRIIAAEHCPHEGKLNPLLATLALARGAEAAGARIRRHTELLSLVRDNQGYEAKTDRGVIRARRVVNAAGPHTPAIAGMMGIDLPVKSKCIQGTITEPTAAVVKHLVYHADRILTFKQVGNGNLLIGGGWPARVDPESGFPRVLRQSIESNMWVAMLIMPEIAHLRLIRCWAGINLKTDGRPILGEVPGVPGFFNAVPADAGMTLGPVTGRLVAEILCRKNATFDLSRFSIERFA